MPTRRPKANNRPSPQAVILSEISVLTHQIKKARQATAQAVRKIEANFRREKARRDLAHDRLAKALGKRVATTVRRLAVLESRLNAL